MRVAETSGKTVDEAIGRALNQLGLRREQVDVDVITEGKAGFLGFGSEEAIVAGMLATLRRDKPLLVLEFNTMRSHDPAALLATLGAIYGTPRYLDLHGKVHAATAAQLTSERVGSDWLLVFAA